MTPYELRFKIFCEAEILADRQYQSEYSAVCMWNENNTEKKEYPKYPSFDEIKKIAEKINDFISSKN